MEISNPTERQRQQELEQQRLQTQEQPVIAPAAPVKTRAYTFSWSWQTTGLTLVLLLAAGLRLIGLDKNGYSNTYYAAAVKSMLTSWHNFFFVSFDSSGFISVDKPPLAFWIQTASAKIFGFSGFSILLPEVLAGLGAVALLYYLVRQVFGPIAGLIAALLLALTPISVAVDRNNTVDSILVLFMLLAAWAFMRATETGRLSWLVAGGVLVGLGFNVKMIEAFMVLPAFYVVYLLATQPRNWLKRALQLGVATIVILVVSFSWASIVDLTPASQRPYVGSSSTNSVYNLIFDYNGVGRQTGSSASLGGGSSGGSPQALLEELPANIRQELESQMGAATTLFESEAGALRLFKQDLAGQVSWLLPLALLGALALAWRGKWGFPLDRRQQSLLLWGGWLITVGAVFSFDSGTFHSYYLVMLASPIAALAGAGLTTMWQDWQTKTWRGWLLPIAIAVTGLYGAYIASSYADWQGWLVPLIIGASLIVCAGLVGLRWRNMLGEGQNKLTLAMLALVVVAMLVGPTAWALSPVLAEGNGALPEANPQLLKGQNSNQMFAGSYDTDKLVQYLETNRQGETYLVGTLSATSAAPIALKSNQAVMAMGGFIGGDPALNADKLSQLVKDGQIRYFLIQDMSSTSGGLSSGSGPSSASGTTQQTDQTNPISGLGGPMGANQEITGWISKQCKVVDAAQWGGQTQTSSNSGGVSLPFGGGGSQKLYDCGGVK